MLGVRVTAIKAAQTVVEVQVPIDPALTSFELPPAVQRRLQTLLDRQNQGDDLTDSERQEAEGLAELADFLSLLRLRAERVASSSASAS